MQSTSKRDYHFLQIILIGSIILQLFFLFQTDNYIFILIACIICGIVFLIAFNFWMHFIDPGITPSQKSEILIHTFKNVFLMKNAVRVIKDGQFQQDYFLLKKKPSIGCLFIHQDSAAVSRQPDSNLRVLQPGYHYLKNNEEMLLSFNLELQNFTYGPDKHDNPFEHKKSGENYTDFHARQLNAQKVRSYSKDSRACYPSFNISYQLGNDFQENADKTAGSILTIAESLIKNNMTGEANNYINELLGKRTATLWADLLSDTTSDELFAESSDKSVNHLIEKINQKITASQAGNKEGTLSGEISGWQFNFIHIYLNELKVQPDDQAKK